MAGRYRFPIRLKILVTLLTVITVVVSLIIMTMANLFDQDKTTYVRDMTSVIAVRAAGEAASVLKSYQERLGSFEVIMRDAQLNPERKTQIIEELFRRSTDFVAISVHRPGFEPVMFYDAKTLAQADMSKENLQQFERAHALSAERVRAVPIYVENATATTKLPLLRLARVDDQDAVITAMIRLDALLRLAKQPSAFQIFIMNSEGTLLVDADVARVASHAVADWIPDPGRFAQQQHLLGTTLEYEYQRTPMISGLAQIEGSELVVAAQIPRAAAYLTARELLHNLMLLALALFIATALISVFLARRLTRPLERVTDAARQVGQGFFDIFVDASSRDEIGVLAGSFNQMATELRQRLEELRRAQAALVQSEKMSAFGQLSAGIAHEVKNPLAGILGHAQLCLSKVQPNDALHNHLSVIENETRRCTEIITNLMKFARQEKTEFQAIDLNEVVRNAMKIVDHQLTMNDVKIELKLLPELPRINGNANQLQQVLMNFAINAQQALEGRPGLVRVTTARTEDQKVLLAFADNGPGIPDEIQAKIFEPFFTTKPAGKGTGLGLSVTYGIIKEHKADIKLESKVGVGTAFIITFPAIVDEIVMESSAA